MLAYKKFVRFFRSLPAENTRAFEVNVTGFAHLHSGGADQHIMRQIAAKEADAVAYGAFYCLTVILRNQKNYEELHKLLNGLGDRFSSHVSYRHLKALYLMESDALYDYDSLLEDAYTSSRFMNDNAGYIHAFAFAFAVICEKQGAEKQNTVEKWYGKALEAINRAIELDSGYAKYYCTKARILAVNKQYSDAINLIKHAISIEKSSRADYALRISEYQYYSLYIQIQQMSNTAEQAPREALSAEIEGPSLSDGIKKDNYVFISYSRKDSAVVYGIIDRLKQAGVRVWYDKRGLHGGSSFTDQIATQIDSCSAMLVLLSNNSINSQWVRRELHYASDERKNLIYVNLDGVTISGGMKFQIGDSHVISIESYQYDKERFLCSIVDEIKESMGENWEAVTC